MASDLFSLKGKTAIVTGAGGFLGDYFVRALLDHGSRVIMLDIAFSENKLEALGKEKEDKDFMHVMVDLNDRQTTQKLYEDLVNRKRIDILINNAFDFSKRTGFNDSNGRLENATFEQLQASFESGIYWAIQATQVFGYAMKRQGRGSIINISSMYALVVPSPELYENIDRFNPPGYSMAKAGLLQFTRYSAAFLAPEVRVNTISPGAFPNMNAEAPNASNQILLDRLLKKIVLQRMGHPEDLTGALIFLASDASSYVTGANIVVDGGFTIT